MLTEQDTTTPIIMGKEFWARRMASRLASRQTPPAMLPDQAIAAAAGVFWALFDDATTEANNALEHAGLQARIGVQRQPNERTYYLDSAGSTPRHIKIAINLRVADGQIHGGALLALSQTGAHVFLVPSFRDEEVQWLVRAVGTPLRAYIVRDLFLSIFADDPAATHRLSPLSGNDFFANPWL